jgi:DNA-binding LacI/PurR family transcriptional regulator
MDKLTFIKGKLYEHKDELSRIARLAGVSRPTVYNVLADKGITVATMNKLFETLKGYKPRGP